MARFLDDYEPVEVRLARFWQDHPSGRIVTDLLPSEPGEFIVHASVFRTEDGPVSATGLAHEVVGSSNVNKTAALENCETSAIGRGLANLGYAPKGARPSREEMMKTQPDHIRWMRETAVQLAGSEETARQLVVDTMAAAGIQNPVSESDAQTIIDAIRKAV